MKGERKGKSMVLNVGLDFQSPESVSSLPHRCKDLRCTLIPDRNTTLSHCSDEDTPPHYRVFSRIVAACVSGDGRGSSE